MKLRDVTALIFQRGWSTLTGVVTVFIIPQTLTLTEQGLFFTFLSLVAIQTIFEAGITSIFFNFIAHERSIVLSTSLRGEDERLIAHARLINLVKIARRWFSSLAIIFFFLVGGLGFYFIQASVQREGLSLHWQTQYILLISAISLSLFNLSRIPILEGFGLIADVAVYRIKSTLLGAFLLWSGMALGLGLWAQCFALLLQNCAMGLLLTRRYKQIDFKFGEESLRQCANVINWRIEILPLQLRLAGSYFCGYFIAHAIVPFTLYFYGSAVAGQVGFMISIFNALASIIASYMYVAIPKYVEYIINRDMSSLKKLYSNVRGVTMIVALIVYSLVIAVTYLINKEAFSLANRLASIQVVACMAIIGFVDAYVGSVATFLRAHKKEPMLPISIIVALSYVAIMIFSQNANIEKIFVLFVAVQVVLAYPLTYFILRKSGILNVSAN